LKTTIDELLRTYEAEADARRRAGQGFAETVSLPGGDACVICAIDEERLELDLRVASRTSRALEAPPSLPSHHTVPLHAAVQDEDESLVAFRALGRMDRWAMRIGLSRRAGLGDHDFDALVYVDTDVPVAWVRSVLASAPARAAVVALATSGMEVRIHGRGAPVVSALRSSSVKKKLPTAAAARSWLASLSVVAYAVSSVPVPGPEAGAQRARMPYPFVLLVASMVVFVASFLGPVGPHSASDPGCDGGICLTCENPVVGGPGNLCFWQSPPARWGLLGGLLVAIGIFVVHGRRLRGTSNAHVVLLQTVFLPALFFAIAGMGIGSTVDALLFGR